MQSTLLLILNFTKRLKTMKSHAKHEITQFYYFHYGDSIVITTFNKTYYMANYFQNG